MFSITNIFRALFRAPTLLAACLHDCLSFIQAWCRGAPRTTRQLHTIQQGVAQGINIKPNGATHNTAAVGFLFTPDGILLMRRGPKSKLADLRGKWAPVGGGVEPGEKLEDGLCREFEEEVGLDIWDLPKRLMGTTNPEEGVRVAHFVIYSQKSMTPVIAEEEKGKVVDPTFFPVKDIPFEECIPDLKEMLEENMDLLTVPAEVPTRKE